MSYTINEIIKITGKSQSTILRWIKELKKNNPKAIIIERKGKARFYKIDEDEVKRRFLIVNKEGEKEEEGAGDEITKDIPKDYVLIPKATLDALQEQLKSKDEQIKKLQEVNYIQSGFIAQVKMLGAGQKPESKKTEDKKEKAGTIEKQKNKKKEKKKKVKKSLLRRLLGF